MGLVLAAALSTVNVSAQTYKDRRVIDVLKELQRQGVRVIYSTPLVRADMWVIEKPTGRDARQMEPRRRMTSAKEPRNERRRCERSCISHLPSKGTS
jgi:hypothetical protein